ncbi:hypothetical protein Tco_0775556 [Tanacetum coccineum]
MNRACINTPFPVSLSIDQKEDMERKISKEEVKRAVWDCGVDKPPGPGWPDPKSNKAFMVKCEQVLTPKDKGGLGVINACVHLIEVSCSSGFGGSILRNVPYGLKLHPIEAGEWENMRFWVDNWYEGGVIKELFPRMFALELNKNATVSSKLNASSLDNSFRRKARSGIEEMQLNSLAEISRMTTLVPCEDRYVLR